MRLNLIPTAVLAALAVASVAAPANAGVLNEVPTAWRLENYAGDNLVIWFTSANPECTNGKMSMSTSMTVEDRNRIWSTVLAAKLANRKVGLSYGGSGDFCVVSSVFID